ncbi:MAG: hypothetical protein ABI390_11030 [Daejeonella sp.]
MKTLTTYLFERVEKNEVFIQKQNDLIKLLEEQVSLLQHKIEDQNNQQNRRERMKVAASNQD